MKEEIIKKDGKLYHVETRIVCGKEEKRILLLGEYEEVEVEAPLQVEEHVEDKPKKHRKTAQEPSQERQEDVKSIEVENSEGEGEIKAPVG